MIPKTIHYCWFGRGEKPKLAQRCIQSWKTICPDYEIIEWNEDNFDIHQNPYLDWCYEHKKWAFLSDLVRLMVVYSNGGIYLDTDVEVIGSLDGLLDHDSFFSFENNENINTGQGFGSTKENPVLKQMIEVYEDIRPDKDGNMQPIGCPVLNTKALLSLGVQPNGKMQEIDHAVILPSDYMNPYDDSTGLLHKTENTVSIHWYSKSALSKKQILRSKITRPFHRWFGTDCFRWLK